MIAPPRVPRSPAERRERLRERLVEEGADALLVFSVANFRYLSGFTGSAGVLALRAEPPDLLWTDFRYATQVRAEVDDGVETEITLDRPFLRARARLAEAGRLLFESAHLTVADWEALQGEQGPPLSGVTGWVEELRSVKSEDEIDAIRRAAAVAGRALEDLLPEVRAGVSERALAALLDHRLAAHGAERPAFETIVAFGERSALPHARPGPRRLSDGDVVLIDFGAVVDGYCCDLTRTVALGEPPAELRRVYRIVRDAQRAVIDGIREGMSGVEADALAREPIAAAGHGERFGHSTGHGLGLEVHEEPRLGTRSTSTLTAGMVVTVEPGIYIEGLGGVRIEDDVVVGPGSADVLTGAPDDALICL